MFSCEFCEVFQNTSERLFLTFRYNSPIKKNLSDVSTIGCLLFLGNFRNKRLQLNLCFTVRLQFILSIYLKSQNERVLSQTFSTKPNTNFMHFLIKTLQNCDNQSFQEYFTEKVPFNENLFTYNVNSKRWIRWYFVEKKILYFRKVFGETTHIGGLFSIRQLQEPLQNIRWSTLQQDLTACRR